MQSHELVEMQMPISHHNEEKATFEEVVIRMSIITHLQALHDQQPSS